MASPRASAETVPPLSFNSSTEKTIGPNAPLTSRHGKACPCCQLYVDPKWSKTSDPVGAGEFSKPQNYEEKSIAVDSTSPPEVEIKKTLFEGWLYKKGTGKDVFGTTSWKPRWVCLALTSYQGREIDVPVLHVFWHYSLPTPSMSIDLESTVVLARDEKGTQDDVHAFDVVHVNGSNPGGRKTTRTFSAPLKERDEWMYAINLAMQEYEKKRRRIQADKEMEKKQRALPSLPLQPRSPVSPRRSASPRIPRRPSLKAV